MVADWLTPQAHARLITTLHSFYGDVLMNRDGAFYPVATQTTSAHHVESLLGHLTLAHQTQDQFACYDLAHLAKLQATRSLTNGLCYALDHIYAGRIDARLGYYFDMLATCDALDQEVRAYARMQRHDMPLRDQFHRTVPAHQWLWHGAGRAATIGLAALVVFYHDGAYRFIFCQRSAQLAINAGMYHVLPAFVFQPNHIAWAEAEWSLTHQFLREFGEELFGMPEFSQADSPTYFYHHPPVADLHTMLADGRAELLPTGIVFNLMSMRAELAMLCIIHDPTWYARHESGLSDALQVERQATYYIPLDTLSGLPDNLHLKMTPQGAAVFWLGLDKARKVLYP